MTKLITATKVSITATAIATAIAATTTTTTAIAVTAITLSAASPAYGADSLWTIDPDHSRVNFSVKHLLVSNVSGEFKKLHGTVSFDGKTLDKAEVTAIVEAASVDTHQKLRDEHLRGKDIFDTLKFPDIAFKSNKIGVNADKSFKVFGTLSMHGVSKDVVLNAKPLETITKDREGKFKTSTYASAELNRKDFGITVDKAVDHGGTVVGEKVKITLNITLTAPPDAKLLVQSPPSESAAK